MQDLKVQEPWASYIKSGAKTVEGRLDKYNIDIGDNFKINEMECEVTGFKRFNSFSDMIVWYGLRNVLPSVKNLHDGVAVYMNFYGSDVNNVIGIEFKVLFFSKIDLIIKMRFYFFLKLICS
jgi:ASC-1-like (ASCH) protein